MGNVCLVGVKYKLCRCVQGRLKTRVWFEPMVDGDFPVRPARQEVLLAEMMADAPAGEEDSKASHPDGFYPSLDEPYELGDYVQLGGDGFILQDIEPTGAYLTLERTEQSETGLRMGMVAPDFEAPGLDSTLVRLADYRGKYVLLDFWGTWCAPCIGEIPHLKEAYEKYTRDEFDILAIANDHPGTLQYFVEQEGLPWTQIVQQDGDAILDAYRINSYPTTFLLDPSGVIVAREGELRGERLASTLAKHL